MTTSPLEAELAMHIRATKLPEPEREHRFHPARRWRFDFCWPERMLAAEVEGATWTGGRHTRGSGFESDCEKYNAAVEAGWRVLRFTSDMVRKGEALQTLERMLAR